jgi:hypothetical protein
VTVAELFEAEKIDNPDFILHNFDGSYWESCWNFVDDNWDKEIESMSLKQAAWLTKILDDCVEKRINGSRKS